MVKKIPYKFGVEIECRSKLSWSEMEGIIYAARMARSIGPWNMHDDRSIHFLSTDPPEYVSRVEFVSPILTGEQGLKEIKTFLDLFEGNLRVNVKCGLHVHIDASRINFQSILNIVDAYVKHEEKIDKLVDPTRRSKLGAEQIVDNNHFCKSNRNYFKTLKKNVFTLQGLKQWLHNKAAAEPHSRYYKVNLHSLLRHGTIEFRHYHGSVNPVEIQNWILFIQNFVDSNIIETPPDSQVVAKLPSALKKQRERMIKIVEYLKANGIDFVPVYINRYLPELPKSKAKMQAILEMMYECGVYVNYGFNSLGEVKMYLREPSTPLDFLKGQIDKGLNDLVKFRKIRKLKEKKLAQSTTPFQGLDSETTESILFSRLEKDVGAQEIPNSI